MKNICMKIIALSAVFCILFASCAFAEKTPLPGVNTKKKDINFSGFTWYTDYNGTLKAAKKNGYENDYESSRDRFDMNYSNAAHWSVAYGDGNGEKGCGGYLYYYGSKLPKVAGYKLRNLCLYLMWNDKKGPAQSIKAKNAAQFYMAKYEFDVEDREACYADLVEKLKPIYGKKPTAAEYYSTKYTYWVNEAQGAVVLSCSNYTVALVYMAPGAEDKLNIVEELVMKKEIEDAAGDMSRL